MEGGGILEVLNFLVQQANTFIVQRVFFPEGEAYQ